MLVGFFGASLQYGDGLITTAISAVEGLVEIKASLHEWVVRIFIGIIFALFMAQLYSTEKSAPSLWAYQSTEGLVIMGTVLLALTCCEALYAEAEGP